MSDVTKKPSQHERPWWLNSNLFAVIIVLVALGLCLSKVYTVRRKLFDKDKVIIRIAHWQLELGYREAFRRVIAEYEKLHPNVRVIQMPVTERVYGQWLNTHLISGTAPDISERGMARLAYDPQYMSRFFVPLTEEVNSVNPYNAGTPVEALAWRETFIDGLRGGYIEMLQDYFSVPLCLYTCRLFYNKDIMRKITGSDQPPRTFQGLLDFCRNYREAMPEDDKTLAPIAASKDTATFFGARYLTPFTSKFVPKLDLDSDGIISAEETYLGMVRGEFDLHSPAVEAYFNCLKALSDQFSTGFMAMGREQASYLFVQGKAAMIAVGSWDAATLFRQAGFEVGVMDFPMPGEGELWSEFISGRANEAGVAGGSNYSVYRFSKHREQAIDFLRFLTSCQYNGLFNQEAGLNPIIVGAKQSELMKPFAPDPRGYNGGLRLEFGSYITTVYNGELWRYLQNECTYDEFADKLEAAIRSPVYGGDKAYALSYDKRRRWARNLERNLAVDSTDLLIHPELHDSSVKYLKAFLQQVRTNNGEDYRYWFETYSGRKLEEL